MKHTKDRVYISGQMSGLSRQHCIDRFRLAEQLLREEGYRNIVNPIRVWAYRFPLLYKIVGYKLALLYDLWLLSRCQRIYKIPGWKASHGAQVESCLAFHLDLFLVAKPARDHIDKEIEELIKKQVITT